MKRTTSRSRMLGQAFLLAWVAGAPACSFSGHSLGDFGAGGAGEDSGSPAGGGHPMSQGTGGRANAGKPATGGATAPDGGDGGDGGPRGNDGGQCPAVDEAGVLHAAVGDQTLGASQICAPVGGRCRLGDIFAPAKCVPVGSVVPPRSPYGPYHTVIAGCGVDVARINLGFPTDIGFVDYVYSEQTGKLVGFTEQPPAGIYDRPGCAPLKQIAAGIATPVCAHTVTYDCDGPGPGEPVDGGPGTDGG